MTKLKIAGEIGLVIVISGVLGVLSATHHKAVRFASVGDPIPNGEYRSWIFVDSDFTSNEHRKRVTFRWSGRNSLDYLLDHDARWECLQQLGAEVSCEDPNVMRLCTQAEISAAKKSQEEAEERYRADLSKAHDVWDQAAINQFDEKYRVKLYLKDCWAPHVERTEK